MRIRSAPRLLAISAALAIAAGCAQNSQWDDLATARRHLKPAPCGKAPSVAGVASVNHDPHEAYLGDWILVSVCHLDTLMSAAAAQQQQVTLFVNGVDTGNAPSGIDYDSGTITFILDRTEANEDQWQPLLYDPLFDRTTTLTVSAGVRGEQPLPRVEHADTTVKLNKLWVDWSTYLWLGLLILVLAMLVAFARNSDMLRDGPTVGGVRQPYSLARTQMAWWFILIVAGYVFIWLVTGDRDTIPPSLLGMMGISAATAVAAVAIAPSSDRQTKRKALFDAEIAAIDMALEQITIDLAEAETKSSAYAAALRPSLEKKRAELEERRAALIVQRAGLTTLAPSSGWWTDLVKDDRGAFAFDRFQVVVWSIVIGGIFLSSVLWELTMPEFSPTLLALMGVSSGTYIGFKLPQR